MTTDEVFGNDTYWRMHEWLLSHQADFNESLLGEAVTQMGLDLDQFSGVQENRIRDRRDHSFRPFDELRSADQFR